MGANRRRARALRDVVLQYDEFGLSPLGHIERALDAAERRGMERAALSLTIGNEDDGDAQDHAKQIRSLAKEKR